MILIAGTHDLERFHSTCSHFWRSPRWLFLDKKTLSLIASGYSNCGTAVDLDAETKRLYHAEMQTVKAEPEWAAELGTR